MAVAEVTSAPEPTQPAEPQPATQPAQGDTPAAIALLDLLPTLDDLPDGFVVTDEGTLALDELAGIHLDPEMQADRLRGWGFTAAAERRFNVPSGSGEPVERMTLLTVIAVEFRAPDDARTPSKRTTPTRSSPMAPRSAPSRSSRSATSHAPPAAPWT